MKGSMWTWIIVLIMVFIVGFVWIIMSNVYTPHIFPAAEENLADYEDASETLDFIELVWNNWAVLTIALLIIYGFISVLRREPNTEYYG